METIEKGQKVGFICQVPGGLFAAWGKFKNGSDIFQATKNPRLYKKYSTAKRKVMQFLEQ